MPTKGKSSDEKLSIAELLALDRANIEIKLKRGLTLTPTERSQLRSENEGAGVKDSPISLHFVKNKSSLCALLEINRQTLDAHLKKPGHPPTRPNGNYCVQEWRAYFGKTSKPTPAAPDVGNATEETGSFLTEREKVFLAIKQEDLDDRRWEKEKKRGLWALKSEIAEEIKRCNARILTELERRLLNVAPSYYQRAKGDIAKCREINRRQIQELREFLHSGEWQ